MKRRARLSVLATALAVVAVIPAARACGLEGGLGNAFAVAHDGSLAVAFAARDAIANGRLAGDPRLETEAAHERADERLRVFAAALPVAPRRGSSFAVLLVEPGVWTRVRAKAGSWELASHVDKPVAGETAVLASEAALRNLIDGQLSAEQALAQGLLTVHGEATQQDRLIAMLRVAFP
jgi:hypothetical protein